MAHGPSLGMFQKSGHSRRDTCHDGVIYICLSYIRQWLFIRCHLFSESLHSFLWQIEVVHIVSTLILAFCPFLSHILFITYIPLSYLIIHLPYHIISYIHHRPTWSFSFRVVTACCCCPQRKTFKIKIIKMIKVVGCQHLRWFKVRKINSRCRHGSST